MTIGPSRQRRRPSILNPMVRDGVRVFPADDIAFRDAVWVAAQQSMRADKVERMLRDRWPRVRAIASKHGGLDVFRDGLGPGIG
jgi:hypothetical protein